VPGEDDVDPEEMRYAPRPPRRHPWVRRLALLVLVLMVFGLIALAGYRWTQNQYYVANDSDTVVIYQGVEADLPGVRMYRVKESSDLLLDDLPTYNARQVREGISASNLEDARGIVDRLERMVICPEPTPTRSPSPRTSPRASPSPSTRPSPSGRPSAQPSPRTTSPSPSPTAPSTTPAVCTES
jgi:PPM family protein phosphatase